MSVGADGRRGRWASGRGAGHVSRVRRPATLDCGSAARGEASAGEHTAAGRTRKRPKELMRVRPFGGSRSFSKPRSLVAAGFLARGPCDLRTWFPGPRRGSLLEPVWRFTSAPSGKTKSTARASGPQGACPRTSATEARTYPRTSHGCGRPVDTLSGRCRMASLARADHGRPGPLGPAVRGLQPSLAQRALPPDPADPRSAERRLARPSASRGRDGHPDRDRAPGRRPRPDRTSGPRPTSRWWSRSCSCLPPR